MDRARRFIVTQRTKIEMPGGLMIVWGLTILWILAYFVIGYNTMVTNYEQWTPSFITHFILQMLRVIGIILTLVRLSLWKHPWAINCHIIYMVVLLVVLECANTVLLGLEIPDCNNTDVPANICNDYRLCCLSTTNAVCSNTLSAPVIANCTPPVTLDDMRWNQEFLIAFVMAIIMLILSALISLLSFLSRSALQAYVTQTELLTNVNPDSTRDVLRYH